MDFLSTYFPFSPSASQTEEQPSAFDEATPPATSRNGNFLGQRNGNVEGLREALRLGEKRNTQVRFIAPLSEGESLKSIKLTPRVDMAKGRVSFTPRSGHLEIPVVSMEEAAPFQTREDAHLNFFGFKIRVPEKPENRSKTGRRR